MKTNANKLRRILQHLFRAQAREIASKIDPNSDKLPDLTPWVNVTVDAVKPLMTETYQDGMVRAAARMGKVTPPTLTMLTVDRYRPGNNAIFGVGTKKKLVAAIFKAANPIHADFDLFNPKVLDAVDRHTFVFARSTLETATEDLQEALRKIKLLMRNGLEAAKATALLAKEIRRIFSNPNRAYMIATTETSRFMHLGQLDSAKENGATHKIWMADYPTACENCMALDGKEVPIDEPFIVDGTGPYSVIMCPPRHPNCGCSVQESI